MHRIKPVELILSIYGRQLWEHSFLLALVFQRLKEQNVLGLYLLGQPFFGVSLLLSGILMIEVESETHFLMVSAEKVREQLASFAMPIWPISSTTFFVLSLHPYSIPYKIL